MPVRARAGRTVEGVLEAYLPYAPVARAIAEDTWRLIIVLFGGLVILYATLFRIVAGASRRLRTPGAARRAHRPAEPHAPARAHGAGDRQRPAQRPHAPPCC